LEAEDDASFMRGVGNLVIRLYGLTTQKAIMFIEVYMYKYLFTSIHNNIPQ